MPLILLHCALASLAALALYKWFYPKSSLPVVGIGPSHPLFNLPSRIASVFKSKVWIDTGYQLVRAACFQHLGTCLLIRYSTRIKTDRSWYLVFWKSHLW